MIEFLLFFTACIISPMYEDYHCNVDIQFLDSQNAMKYHWWLSTGQPYGKDDNIRGLHTYNGTHSKIYILTGHDGEYASMGCTVLWHELLHAYGYDHDIPKLDYKAQRQMPYCNWSPN